MDDIHVIVRRTDEYSRRPDSEVSDRPKVGKDDARTGTLFAYAVRKGARIQSKDADRRHSARVPQCLPGKDNRF